MIPKISVIIPVFNTEKYLRECLNSVLFQSLYEIEIICANDGSTDNSLDILQEYAKKDTRIKIINKQNEGPGITRNSAVKIAKGEYLLFLDSDDFLEKDALETLYNQIETDKSDIIFFNINYIYEDKSDKIDFISPYENRLQKKCFNIQEAFDILYDTNALAFKMYKRNLWISKNIHYSNHLLGEDSLPYFIYLAYCKKISICKKHLYNYRKHSNSLSQIASRKYNDLFEIFYNCEKALLDTPQGINLISSYLKNRIRSFVFWYKSIDLKYKHNFYDKTKNVFLYINSKYGIDTIKDSECLNEFKKFISMNYFQYRLYCFTKTFFIILNSHFN